MAHDWIASTLGHGYRMCSKCKTTDDEAAALGELDTCPKDKEPKAPKLVELKLPSVVSEVAREVRWLQTNHMRPTLQQRWLIQYYNQDGVLTGVNEEWRDVPYVDAFT